jgi:hypothetical protein
MKTLPYLSAIIIVTVIIGLVYVAVQQTYRTGANDPQTEILYTIKERMEKGMEPLPKGSDSVDLQKSLAVFVAAYDSSGNATWSTGYLHGEKPNLPRSLFQQAKMNGEHWVTWQPQRDVRMSIGILPVNGGPVSYIVAGRSLKLVEQRVSKLLTLIFVCWLICFCVILINWFVEFVRIHHINQKKGV